MTITITVASIEWPKEGKKQGSVIDSTGKRWGVWADKLPNYQQFQTYDILEFDTNVFRGTTYFTIKKAIHKPSVNGVGSQGVSQPRPSYNPQPSTGLQSFPSDDQRRMDIFVAGAVNNAMANQNTNPFQMATPEMVRFVRMIKEAWSQVLGPNAVEPQTQVSQQGPISTGIKASNDDMNDDIPF